MKVKAREAYDQAMAMRPRLQREAAFSVIKDAASKGGTSCYLEDNPHPSYGSYHIPAAANIGEDILKELTELGYTVKYDGTVLFISWNLWEPDNKEDYL